MRMAYKAGKAFAGRMLAKRDFAANFCPRPIGEASNIQSTVLENKMVVATGENALPITRIAVVFRAGSRHENYANLGASHLLRISCGLTSMYTSGFAITRNLQEVGAAVTVASDREIIAYILELMSDEIEPALCYFRDMLRPAFKPWELSDAAPRIHAQLGMVSPQARAVELLHKAAFRRGLGNSIYIPEYKIGNISPETLLDYVSTYYTAPRCAIVGVGIEHNILSGIAQSLDLCNHDTKLETASYYGGDLRKDTKGDFAAVAIAGQGAALLNQKETLAFAVLQRAVGFGQSIKRGGISGIFGQALAPILDKCSVSYSAFNASYAEAGLFGFVVAADSENIGKAVEALVHAFKSGSVTNEHAERGKTLLKRHVLETYASDGALLNEMTIQAAINNKVQSADALLTAIDGITQKDVQDAQRKAISAPLSLGAVGNLGNVPHITEMS